MGSQICQNIQESKDGQINLSKIVQVNIYKPPQIQKPQPIINLLFPEENNWIEKERMNSLPKQNSSDITLTRQELNQKKPDPQDINCTLGCNDQLDLLNSSKDDSNSGLQELKHKSILKNKMMAGSNSSSSNNAQKDNESAGSQRSIKKVTFDKKQKVIYSSFRKPKA
ncbi:unnamed protein product (macronuclear) [Paramecium tetraurelia]|uniref:Uncharacterized protein n=1 Tax=Paramecium tetraurelia TaxID=5888 RepID=A0DW13_PARTE|nr:uncharacterized protein GSPATT00020883001 [Paramecium tetraurelia]CAK87230.1 unnamed protein product [Paramecium tetraurelia]|eukprot:XP_001454627.1 hypothetical protein (macronuclear) [Paramecium tetraurelia strain d4-2]